MRLIDADEFERQLNELLPKLIERYGYEEALRGLHFSFNDCIDNLRNQETIEHGPISFVRCKNILKKSDFDNLLGELRKQNKNIVLLPAYTELAHTTQSSQWIPCSERLPDKDGRYLVTNTTLGANEVSLNIWFTNLDQWLYNGNPIAWMPLPSPYEP